MLLNIFGMMAGEAVIRAVVSNPINSPSGGLADSKGRGSRTSSSKSKIRVLEANLAKTLMICESLWEMLRDEHGLTDEDLRKKLYEVDMRDGTLDGKNQRKAVKCPNCRHMVSARHPACLYCGQVIDDSAFAIE